MGRGQNGIVETLVGGASFRRGQAIAFHLGQRRVHDRQLIVGAAARGKFGRRRLDHAAQLEQVADEGAVGFAGEHPGEHFGVEHVPARARQDAGAGLRAAFQHALGDQDADRLAIGGARYAKAFRRLDLALEQVAGLVPAGQDGGAHVAGDRLVNAERAFVRRELAFRSVLALAPHSTSVEFSPQNQP